MITEIFQSAFSGAASALEEIERIRKRITATEMDDARIISSLLDRTHRIKTRMYSLASKLEQVQGSINDLEVAVTPDYNLEWGEPDFESRGAMGMDLRCAEDSKVELKHGEKCLIETGLRVNIPRGWGGIIGLRSSWWDRPLLVANSPGMIDSDYPGSIKVGVINLGTSPQIIHRGERFAQIAFTIAPQPETVRMVSDFNIDGGKSGFGSTGKF